LCNPSETTCAPCYRYFTMLLPACTETVLKGCS
jgi:hypothetical protein